MKNKIEKPRFLKEYQLWKACGKDDIRETLQYVCFEHGYAYASNGHILARVNINTLTSMLSDEEKALLNGYCIHADAYKVLLRYDYIKIVTDGDDVSVVCPLYRNSITIKLVSKKTLKWPDFEKVLQAEGASHPIEKIGIEKTLLNNLTDAIGMKRIKMDFYSESSKIIVSPINEDYLDIKGLIMPIMTTGTMDF